MMIIGCDFHPSWQQVCWLDTATGESGEQSWYGPVAMRNDFTGK